MHTDQELGIYSDVPFLDRFMRFLDGSLWLLFAHPKSAGILDIITSLLFYFVVSSRLRALPHSRLFGVLVIVILAIVGFGWGLLLLTNVARLERLVLGDPAFGKIGGLRRKVFFTSLKLAHAIQYEFNASDNVRLQDHGALDRDLTEALLKWNYRKNIFENIKEPRPDLDETWGKLWNERILNLGTEGRTLRDALNADEVAFSIIPLQLLTSASLVSPFVKIFQLILIYLLARYLDGVSPLVTVIQAGVAMSFIFSLVWFIHHAYKLGEIQYLGVLAALPPELQSQFEPRLQTFQDFKVRPTRIIVKKRYLSLVRDYLLTPLLRDMLLNTLFALLMVATTLVIGRIAFPAQWAELAAWYEKFAVGLLLIPFGFLGSYYLSFWILQNVRRIIAPVVASLVGALLPFLIVFIVTGKLQVSQLANQASATLAAVSILISATLGSLAKKKLEEDD